MSDLRYEKLERRYRRAWLWGLGISVVGHLLLFSVFDSARLPVSPFSAAGERRGDMRAAEGGGLEAVEFRAPAEAQPTPVPVEEPTADVVETEPPEQRIEDMVLPAIALADALTVPGSSGALAVPGLAEGTGEGDGGSELEGRFRVVPPRPRGLILPPGDRPADVRGKEVEVWVYVTAAGRVVPDSTRLFPATGDRRFDRKLRDHAAGWRFEPARQDGRAVSEWFRYTIIM